MTLLSVVIPVFNEKTTIREIFRRVEVVPVPGVLKEIILVDDFSTDGGPSEILQGLNELGVS